MCPDIDEVLDLELRRAGKTLTDNLFHYTNADAALFGILSTGTLRLSPFDSTNDLWESRPTHSTLGVHADDVEVVVGMDLWDEIDRHVRLNAKLACLTMDWDLPDSVVDRDALRGWAHLSLWAHYGGAHSGICLRFDRPSLIAALQSSDSPKARSFHGPVEYRSVSFGAGPHSIDIGQVREFGVDVVALAHAEANSDPIFFRKHRDWANETEYRLVRLDDSMLPYSLDIRPALTGVFLGEAFPQHRLPALREVLRSYSNVEVFQIRFHNRRFYCWPQNSSELTDKTEKTFPWGPPRRVGTFAERIALLRESELSASERRVQAEVVAQPGLAVMAGGVAALARATAGWPETNVEVHERIEAVPVEQRSRRPGVQGERVDYEAGFMMVVNATDADGHDLLASVAVQVLSEDQIRVHAAVTNEVRADAPDHRTDLWRWVEEGTHASVAALAATAISELSRAVEQFREPFDVVRGRT